MNNGENFVMKVKYLILGAGPSGLSFANRIKQLGENDFLVLEKENEAGGLCRSKDVDGSPLDIGGGHFLDVRDKGVNEFLFGFMPEEEWNLYERNSQICLGDYHINHPLEANIWQMPQEEQIEYLKSIAVAGCNLDVPMPQEFIKWIDWKLGKRIAEKYMLPYNKKMFGDMLNELGTYWLEKLPNVSFEETLLSCLNKQPYGTQPGHAQFYYPKKYGYGELWKRMADALQEKILYGKNIATLNFEDTSVTCSDGSVIKADYIITTIPWTSFENIRNMTETLCKDIQKLKHTSVTIEYHSEKLDTDAQWIYYPDETLEYHRILVRSNFLPGAKGYWTETNTERYTAKEYDCYNNEYAYPLNTIDKPLIMSRLLKWAEENKVIGLGRWGEWQHYNSEVVVRKALELANKLVK